MRLRSLLAALAWCIPSVAALAQGATRAYDFYSKFGVNGNLDFGGTVAQELADMNYVGIRKIRSSAYQAKDFQTIAQLAAQGVKQHVDYQASNSMQSAPMQTWLNALKQYIVTPYGAKIVTGVSGPNEVDLHNYIGFVYGGLVGVPAANQAQADLYAGMKADPVLSGIPVDMWPLGGYRSLSTSAVGDQTAHCDRINMHDYYPADNTHQFTGVTGDIQIGLQSFLLVYRKVCNRTPFLTTETGWYTGVGTEHNLQGTDEYVQARLLLNDIFDHAMLPDDQEVYIFTLRWGPGGWGIINNDGTPKIAGTALHNLTAILNDPSAAAATFTPRALNYSLSGMPAAGGNFLIQKSNGAFQLLLWNETPIWDGSRNKRISIPTATVTVSLPPGSSGSVYNPTQKSTPILTFSNVSQLQVGLNDSPLIIQVQ